MQIDKRNFHKLLPSIIESIEICDFVAFDCEFSGLITQLNRIEGFFPNHIQFYERIKQTAYNFRIMQLGITVFIFDGKHYLPKPYNFYVNAQTHTPTFNNVMVCEVESMEFLANNNLDFNAVFKHGINNSRLYAKEHIKHKHNNHPVPPLTYHDMFFCPQDRQLITQIQQIIAPMKQTPKLEKIINFKTKNVLSYFRSKYENLLTDKPKKNMAPLEYNVRMLKKLIEEEQKKQEDIMMQKQSLEIVLEAIIKGKKPIVGHFPNLDIGLIYHTFLDELPQTYDQFCALINKNFPYIFDTKVLSRRIQSKMKGLKVDLASLFRACFNQKLLQPFSNLCFENCQAYMSKQQHHQAGYDSFITGCAFVGMANYMTNSREKVNFKQLENENKLLYSRFSGEVSINGNMYCSNAYENDSKIVIQKKNKEQNPEWRNHAEILSQFGNLSVYEDHDELYYVYETIKNINQILELLPALELKQYSKRKIIRARNMYNEKVDKYL